MQRKERVLILAWGVTLCALGLVLQASCSRTKAKEAANEVSHQGRPEAVVNEASAQAEMPPVPQALPPDIEELNKVQMELAAFTDDALGQEEEKLNALMKENDLVGRINKKLASEDEKARGKKILIRLALIRVEKSKRAPQVKKPEQG